MSKPSFLKEYRSVASTLAAVSTYLGSYSLIDRMSNALSPDSAYKVIYEMSRILNAILKEESPRIKYSNESNKDRILVYKDNKEFTIDGRLAETSELELFLEDMEKNPHIARSLASLAMYLSAMAKIKKSEGGT